MVVRKLLQDLPDLRLRALVAWVPMLPADSLAAAQAAGTSLPPDDRVAYGWDDAGALGDPFAQALGLSSRAWDVYLLYPAGARWDGALPPPPTRWMHQLSQPAGAAPPELRLNAAQLTAWARDVLAQTPQ